MSIASDRLEIDGQELQLEKQISVNFQGIDMADQTRIKEPYTHTIEVSGSRKNEEILGRPSDYQTALEGNKAYESRRADVYIAGAPVIFNAKMGLVSAGERIRVAVVGKGTEFYENIKGKSIKELDFGTEYVTYGSGTGMTNQIGGVLATMPNMETYINPDYAAVAPTEGTLNPRQKIARHNTRVPFASKKLILEQIVSEAGYYLNTGYLNIYGTQARERAWNNGYISMRVPAGTAPWTSSSKIYYADWLPDIDQLDFVKGILYQFGAYIVVDSGIVFMISIPELVRGKTKPIDWSEKVDFSKRPEVTYDIGYAQSNTWRYENYSEEGISKLQNMIATNAANSAAEVLSSYKGFIGSDNQNLEKEREVGRIPWQPCMALTVNNADGNPRQVAYIPAFDHVANEFVDDYPTCDLVLPTTPTTYRNSGGSAETWSATGFSNGSIYPAWHGEQEDGSPIHISNGNEEHGLSFDQRIIPNFYPYDLTRFIRQPLRIRATLNLSIEDIKPYVNPLGLFAGPRIRPVWIEELNGYFQVAKIESFTAGKPTKVDLIKI